MHIYIYIYIYIWDEANKHTHAKWPLSLTLLHLLTYRGKTLEGFRGVTY